MLSNKKVSFEGADARIAEKQKQVKEWQEKQAKKGVERTVFDIADKSGER